MRRFFESLRPADRSAINSVPDGLFLVRVDRVQYRWHAQKPYYEVRFAVLEPKHLAGCLITGRLYCTARAMWKVSWFLRDFGYDTELLGKDEIDDQALLGRAFERALAAFFLRQDAAAALFQEWKLCQDQKLEYSHGDTWDRMLEQGIQLLDRFCQDDRVRIPKPRGNLQIKFARPISG